MQIGICASMDHAALAAQIGFDFLEENVQSFLTPLESDAIFSPHLEKARRCLLPITAANCFLPGVLKVTGPQVDPAALQRYAAVAFRRAAEAGIKSVVFGSGAARQIPAGFSVYQAVTQFLELLKRLAPMAAAQRISILVEPLNRGECNFINTLAQGADLVRKTGYPSVQLLADLFHMLRNGETAADAATYGSFVQHVHVAEKRQRTCPGVDNDDFIPFFRALVSSGYRGGVSLECSFPNGLQADGPNALATLRRQITAAGGST